MLNMSLSPKPNKKKDLLGWKDLDSKLQAVFRKSNKSKQPVAIIDSDEYFMTINEIKSEAEKQGYTVTINGTYIEFR